MRPIPFGHAPNFQDGIQGGASAKFKTGNQDHEEVARYEIYAGNGYSAPESTTAGEEAATTDGSDQSDSAEEQTLSVSTQETEATEDFTATLTGEVTALTGYESADCVFEWRAVGGNWTTTGVQTLTEPGEFSTELTDLDSGTEYEFYAQAETESERVDGDTLSFETREVIDESFHFDWEDGDYVTDPTWHVQAQWGAAVSVILYFKGEFERWVVAAAFDSIDRLANDADCIREVALVDAVALVVLSDRVFHEYWLSTYP